jgi:hypothetical protein
MLFSDVAIVFTVISEREVPTNRPEEAGRSYMIPRDLTAQVDEVVWRRESSNEKLVPAAGAEFTIRNQGWWVGEGGGTPHRTRANGKYVREGETYMAMFLLHVDGPDRLVMLEESVVSFQDGKTAVLGDNIVREIVGKTTDQIASDIAELEERIGPLEPGPVMGSVPDR